ncbi:MAG: flavodoxin family protein [Phenylobacterium sp.]|jgi:multimeric flavodoxin WrbA|uniref:flavodoxin family protein n=1 Tax=Phenylobacterium sp. TaxID=1871053 RepID=UPI002A2F6EF6|nr:flavodoxin family protein [Phenylobacterium sp.]MDD3837938.1 flavodoxin family protein [Phenylobacterium sp.]MDX9998393.1 flavodoxin family protein [Phenylobacterium sp.]
MTKVAIVYHSGSGRTGLLAQAVHRGAARVEGVTADLLRIVPEQLDRRTRWRDEETMRTLQDADGVIFGCTTLMGMPSAPFKAFMEGCFDPWWVQGWKDKFAGGFTNSASLNGDKTNTLIQLLVFAAQMGMIWIPMGDHPGANWSGAGVDDVNRLGSFLGPMSQSLADLPVEQATPPSDLVTGERYGERFARIVRHWVQGGEFPTERYVDKATSAARLRQAAATAAA